MIDRHVTRGSGDQSVEQAAGLDRVPPSERRYNAPDMAERPRGLSPPSSIQPDLFDANEWCGNLLRTGYPAIGRAVEPRSGFSELGQPPLYK